VGGPERDNASVVMPVAFGETPNTRVNVHVLPRDKICSVALGPRCSCHHLQAMSTVLEMHVYVGRCGVCKHRSADVVLRNSFILFFEYCSAHVENLQWTCRRERRVAANTFPYPKRENK